MLPVSRTVFTAYSEHGCLTCIFGASPAKAHKSWDTGQWAVLHAFTELLPFFRGGLLITKSTEANTVWMTSVTPMSASKLTPQKAVLSGHKSFVSKAAMLKNAPKMLSFSELFLSLPSSPDNLRAFKSCIKQDDKHVTSDSFSLSSRGELRYSNCFHRASVSCISAAVPGRGK